MIPFKNAGIWSYIIGNSQANVIAWNAFSPNRVQRASLVRIMPSYESILSCKKTFLDRNALSTKIH
jgi:hypothetical protein